MATILKVNLFNKIRRLTFFVAYFTLGGIPASHSFDF